MSALSYAATGTLLRLWLPDGRPAVGFDLASIGEVQFLLPVLQRLVQERPDARVVMVHHEDTLQAFAEVWPELARRIIHVRRWAICGPWLRGLNLYLTTEQFSPGPAGVYTVTLFHGQPSKGVTFGLPGRDPLHINDAFFLYGPLQRQALDEHLKLTAQSLPSHLSLFDIGYAKSDALLSGAYDRNAELTALGLDPTQRTVLYAPAFNDGASMRTAGVKILETLCAMPNTNVLAKLPIDCLQPTTDLYATGGIDWFEVIGRLERNHENFRLIRKLEADPALVCADVLVTCVSSIGFELMALGRPVVFIDTPEFFRRFLGERFPGVDVEEWAQRTTVNGGREFGLVVRTARELPAAIQKVLEEPENYPKGGAQLRNYLLYNSGRGAEAAVAEINRLLQRRVRSTRCREAAQALVDQVIRRPPQAGLREQLRSWLVERPKAIVRGVIAAAGYEVRRRGPAVAEAIATHETRFIDASTTVAAARAAGLSVCEYREREESDPRKVGRRDRIVDAVARAGVLDRLSRVCEIGTGTGMYMEKVLSVGCPQFYEVYEVDPGWVEYLRTEYGGGGDCAVICHPADGKTLSFTPDNSCDLVHAHAVFVYIPLVDVLGYLQECVRVCRPGGYMVFDYIPETEFASLAAAEAWQRSGHRFPVVIPRALLQEFVRANGLTLVSEFAEIYGAGSVTYLILQKPCPMQKAKAPRERGPLAQPRPRKSSRRVVAAASVADAP